MIENLADGLRIVRRVHATRADAFDAWVNPARLREWFGPPGTQVVAVEGELAVGHDFRLNVQHGDGAIDQIRWRLREIVAPERLVFGWSLGASDRESTVTITFVAAGEVTEIELVHSGVQTAREREMFAFGWDGCFGRLEAILHPKV
jgi:uncharacterized protein YndB with AHSA1/START domain